MPVLKILIENRANNPLKTFHFALFRPSLLQKNRLKSPVDLTLAKLNYHHLLGELVGSMAKLTALGFRKSAIAEAIISTYNDDGSPNAAPVEPHRLASDP